ncbi:hypothetical protein IJT93_02005 [bacterium]|nr:hypothetical protein [bacterium]
MADKEQQVIEPDLFSQYFAESLGDAAAFLNAEPAEPRHEAEASAEAPAGSLEGETERGSADEAIGRETELHAEAQDNNEAADNSVSLEKETEETDGGKPAEEAAQASESAGEGAVEAEDIVPENKLKRLRVIFAGMDGRFSTTPLQVIAQAHDIVGIVHSQPRKVKESFIKRWLKSSRSEGNLERFAKHYGCPYISVSRDFDYDFVRFIKHLKPDIICVSNFSIILPPDIFELPKYGAINLHLSSLPEYRGPNPWLWMFYDGCEENKYVVHQIDAGEDTGPILAEDSYNIPPNVTCSELADCVLPNAACLMLRVLEDIASDNAHPVEQPYKENLRRARYVAPGENLIDWQEWGCEKTAAFLQGAGIWYEPFPLFPGLARIYQNGVKGSSKGKPGSNHFRLWHGWISCKDGIVPYKISVSSYDFWHLFMPIILLVFIYIILCF